MKEMPVLYQNKEDCCGCKACANACPVDAISFKEDEYGFFYPQTDADQCIGCRKCVAACDFQKREGGVPKNYPLRCYAAVHKDKSILKKSTSGGVFTALADIVFEQGGVVFGCAFDADLNPKHIMAENMEQLVPMRGSKYVQSDAGGGTYKQVKQLLEAGRTVLFTGTPCQVAALYSYMGNRETENLITAEIVCHGVASRKAFFGCLEHLEKKSRKQITGYMFRSKSHGWGIGNFMYDQTYFDSRKKPVMIPYSSSFFIVNYRKNNLTRESCFRCPYAERKRRADFTMGDFHGYSRMDLKLTPYRGLSILLVNTKRAEQYLAQLSDRLDLEPVLDISQAMSENGNLCFPPPRGEKWDEIMEANAEGRLEDIINDFERNAKKGFGNQLKQTIPTPLYFALKDAKHRMKRDKND